MPPEAGLCSYQVLAESSAFRYLLALYIYRFIQRELQAACRSIKDAYFNQNWTHSTQAEGDQTKIMAAGQHHDCLDERRIRAGLMPVNADEYPIPCKEGSCVTS